MGGWLNAMSNLARVASTFCNAQHSALFRRSWLFGSVRARSGCTFTKNHEWLQDNEDGSTTLGITEFKSSMIGDIVFAEWPKLHDHFQAHAILMRIESVKAVSDVAAPHALKVLSSMKRLRGTSISSTRIQTVRVGFCG